MTLSTRNNYKNTEKTWIQQEFQNVDQINQWKNGHLFIHIRMCAIVSGGKMNGKNIPFQWFEIKCMYINTITINKEISY